MTTIDLIALSGGPQWLSPLGRIDTNAIRAKHREKWLAENAPTVKPAKPETVAKLHAVDKRIKRRAHARRWIVWQQAIAILDQSEPEIRDVIERGLSGVAALDGVKYNDAMKAVDAVVSRVAEIRTKAIKKAFRLIRDKGL